MNYIIMDLEWNIAEQELHTIETPFRFNSEIIEIGAVKLDDSFRVTDEFRMLVKPQFIPTLSPAISRLTGIGKRWLEQAVTFPEAYRDFHEWCGESYCFMTWGPDDIPVLMDNMLLYGMSLESIPYVYDLQRMFGHEIARDDRQWALEKAMAMLSLQGDRAHDALNDAKNTELVAQYLPMEALEEYRTAYVSYQEDTESGIRNGVLHHSCGEAIKDAKLTDFICPYTGELLTGAEWRCFHNKLLGCARSSEGDEYLITLKPHRCASGVKYYTRQILEMSIDLWELFTGGGTPFTACTAA